MYPTVTLDDVRRRGPAIALLPSEPYSFRPEHSAEIAAAIPGIEIRDVDGQDLFWWGTRTAGAIDRLRAAVVQTDGPSSP